MKIQSTTLTETPQLDIDRSSIQLPPAFRNLLLYHFTLTKSPSRLYPKICKNRQLDPGKSLVLPTCTRFGEKSPQLRGYTGIG